ncbi:MAG TPA: 2-oxoglutarate dehydrogenase E1 component [Pirellulales bacterium]|nr:2-oxoglutarate dehydrogenase E1 component [Pirellulales bacterium]
MRKKWGFGYFGLAAKISQHPASHAPGARLPAEAFMEDLKEQISTLSLGFIEGLYADFLKNPDSVAPEWRDYFRELGQGAGDEEGGIGPSFRPSSIFNPPPVEESNGHTNGVALHDADDIGTHKALSVANLQDRVDQLIRAYRVRGHMIANLDPLGRPRPIPPELQLEFYGLTDADLERAFSTRTISGPDVTTLRGIVQRMRNTYCRSIGVQFMHIDDLRIRTWLQHRMEGTENRLALLRAEQLRIFTRLTDAVIFEEFIQKKYVGAKSFSLEGAESLVPLLDLAIEKAGEQHISEIVLGMAHRGRLNVLANIMGKSPRVIFREFEDIAPEMQVGGGDVKYHLGHSTDWTTAAGQKIHLSLAFNPSHLEFVNPVVLGRMRAKMDRINDVERRRGLAIVIHGDAAFAGEGVVQETFNLSGLVAYSTGGSVHIVVNNQIGFTTPPAEGRSTSYCTDVAKMLQSPIFHVNGEDPEAVAQVVRLALDFRHEFQRDVVIDMYCYRLRGHNEGDEPSFTQPLLYQTIEKHKSSREGYLEHLLKLGGMTREDADKIAARRREVLEQELSVARSQTFKPRTDMFPNPWMPYLGGADSSIEDVYTGVERQRLVTLLDAQSNVPEDFHPHAKIERILKARRDMAQGAKSLDWAAGEMLAFATIAADGFRVRLTGQDVGRGTFSHRHAVLHDIHDGHTYIPLQNLGANQAPVEIFNSPLSEIGVLGFEYGYSLDYPDALVGWEAQFGDFVNVAQVIIDQFIASAEEKWRRLSGLTMLLPHGFEGAGPEHSSARLERFLELFANDNIQVAYPSNPAQLFHLLRRQVMRELRKPLIVMTPKGLLRSPDCVSSLDDLATGRFLRVIPDSVERKRVSRVLLCTGKIYYELEGERKQTSREDVAIIRLEQLAPIPVEQLRTALLPYADGTPVFWVQEEPENMGAWRFLRINFGEKLFDRLPLAGIARKASASPATGSHSSHKREQRELLAKAFGGV